MKKEERIGQQIAAMPAGGKWPTEYAGYFRLFNSGAYYEAHDVLEHLWLRCEDEEKGFYQGLILYAGAFVHLRLQRKFPDHPKHGKRLRPAAKLLALALQRFAAYPDAYMGLDLKALRVEARRWMEALERGRFAVNPWRGEQPPNVVPPEG